MPITITLSAAEQQTLSDLTRQEQSALDFWQHALFCRGFAASHWEAIPMISPQGPPGTYRLEWTSRKLGPASIAEGRRLGKVGRY